MRTIFVKIKCELGRAYDVADTVVRNVGDASEVHSISDYYGLLVKCYLNYEAVVGRFVTQKLRMLPDVKDAFTLVAFKAFT
jgi:hypothetical protein